MFELNNIDSIKIGIASPEKIREWSYGEVKKAETLNYRTQKPEPDGLFCEKIFGPTQDWRCRCGKYKLNRYKGVICDKCGVEVTKKKVRRERMGHIELATPVSHIWYFKGNPSRIGTLLDLTVKQLEQILYYVCFVVTDPKDTPLQYKQVLTDKEYRDAQEIYGVDSFKAGMGAEAIKQLLIAVDLDNEAVELKKIISTDKGQKRIKASRKLEVVESFRKSENKPSWMILEALPVLPPDLRPMVQIDGGRTVSPDLNELYRRVINRNNRLKELIAINGPDVIIRNEKRMLQEAVDTLIENGKRGKPVQNSKQRDLKSLYAILKGKHGRFRENMLGKRVDYSGRSVIVVGPELKMHQCGLPKEMALELFKPFVMKELIKYNHATNLASAKRVINASKPIIWDMLDKAIKGHPVILNRAPTLHKLGIQAFEPVLVEGKSIKLHPLVCEGFHADFDGDQMPVHIPLSIEARAEAQAILLSTNNILRPSNGKSIVDPSKDMVIGVYYMTIVKLGAKGEGTMFTSEDEAIMAHATQNLDLQAQIYVRREAEFEGKIVSGRVATTVGKILFNRNIPQNIGYIDRTKRENVLRYEIEEPVSKNPIAELIKNCYYALGVQETVKMLDHIKEMGFKYSTLASLTVSIYDFRENKIKDAMVKEAEEKVKMIEKQFSRGLMTLDEKMNKNIEIWNDVTSKIENTMFDYMEPFNPIRMIVESKARGTKQNLNQVGGIIGIVSTTSGAKLDVPVKSNFKKGMQPIEYFLDSRSGRKVLADTAMKTKESGYLTRRLVDVTQDVIITEMDCFETLGESIKGMIVKPIVSEGRIIQKLSQRLEGRVSAKDIVNPETGEIIVKANELITIKQANEIEDCGIEDVEIRSVFTCRCPRGVCAKCYGKNMMSDELVPLGETVGVIAAQAIGEPGTQLSMKNFAAGVVGGVDISRGLPRIEEIFEARDPKGKAYISEVAGTIKLREVDKRAEITVMSQSDGEVIYLLPYGVRLKVKDGDRVEPGTPFTEGPINPKELLRTKGSKELQEYLLEEVVSVYNGQSIDINTKHIEIVIRQMVKKVKIENEGDTTFIPGEYVDLYDYEKENQRVLLENGIPALAKKEVLGITKASLKSDSFLSATSFQHTSSVLTDSAVKSKVDKLLGLKENVLIGKLIPAGTGFAKYKNVRPVSALKNVVETRDFEEEQDDFEDIEF